MIALTVLAVLLALVALSLAGLTPDTHTDSTQFGDFRF